VTNGDFKFGAQTINSTYILLSQFRWIS
jgi:hypothetical protein